MGETATTRDYRSEADKIRDDLKRAGYKRTQVSVKQPHHSSVDVTIRDAHVRISKIYEIAMRHERVDYCGATGEILSGGNTFVSVDYSRDALAPLMAQILTAFASYPRGTSIEIGPHLAGIGGSRFDTEVYTITWLMGHSPRSGTPGRGQLRAHGVEHGASQLAIDLLDRGIGDLDEVNRRRFAINAHEAFAPLPSEGLSMARLVMECDKRTGAGISSADVNHAIALPIGQWFAIDSAQHEPFTIRRIGNVGGDHA